MEFTECRQKVFQDIVSVVDNKIDFGKVFLLLGGIRAGFYQYTAKGLPFFIPGGIEMLHYPYILEQHNISYRKVSIDEILRNREQNPEYMEKKLFILLFMDSILETRNKEELQDNMFGDSQLTIREIDLEQSRILLNHENTKHYWVDIEVYREVEKKRNISMTNELCIYELDKQQLRCNYLLNAYIHTSDKELIKNCVEQFEKNRKLNVTENCIRYDGRIAYQFMENNLLALSKEYRRCKEQGRQSNMEHYIRKMSLQYKRFASLP